MHSQGHALFVVLLVTEMDATIYFYLFFTNQSLLASCCRSATNMKWIEVRVCGWVGGCD